MISIILFALLGAYCVWLNSKIHKNYDEAVQVKSQIGAARYDFTRVTDSLDQSMQSVKDRQKLQAETIEHLKEEIAELKKKKAIRSESRQSKGKK